MAAARRDGPSGRNESAGRTGPRKSNTAAGAPDR